MVRRLRRLLFAGLVAAALGAGYLVATLHAAPITITFTLDSAIATKLMDAIVANNVGSTDAFTGTYQSQPETQQQYAKRKTYEWWRAQVVAAAHKTAETQGTDITGQ